ncbi:hypothetical protein J23TS9_09940 [Paenibacillus sp. J23TS9]|nr:hypothetical protein J23TS9_09940 [Paenibacillus sp. J23TS9]
MKNTIRVSYKFFSYCRITLFFVYAFLLFIFGICNVPFYTFWGPNKEYERALVAPIWSSMDVNRDYNGYNLIYNLNSEKLCIEILIISLIVLAIYLIIREAEKQADENNV